MRRVRIGRIPLTAIVGMLALLISACGSSGNAASSSSPGSSAPEKSHIVVGVLPIADVAGFYIALHRGFFKQQGLTVTPEVLSATPQATAKLLNGTMDFSVLNYVSTYEIEEGGVKFRIVADSSQSAIDYFDIMLPKGSNITSPAQLKGKTVAVPAPKAIGTLGVDSVLKPYGMQGSDVKFAYIPFPNMLAALKTHQVDAAVEVEPFITQMEAVIGAHSLVDMMTGPMANLPIGGFGTVDSYVKRYPKTVAAFQRAFAEGQQIAASDRKAVEQILPTYTRITPQVAAVMSLPTYPTSLSAVRLQRVADLMLQFHLIQKSLNVAPMIVPPPSG
jgi:NitT/TauT family transport system substrate-binding protein